MEDLGLLFYSSALEGDKGIVWKSQPDKEKQSSFKSYFFKVKMLPFREFAV